MQIPSGTKQVALYEGITESFNQMIHFKHSFWKETSDIYHLYNWFAQNADYSKFAFYTPEIVFWIINLEYYIGQMVYNWGKRDCLYELFDHLLNWFYQKAVSSGIHSKPWSSFKSNTTIVFMNVWLNALIKWFIQKHSFIQERNKWLSVWVSHWILYSTNLIQKLFIK